MTVCVYSISLIFQLSLCDDNLTELSNPGAGGSIFYISEDDEFIIKTAQHKEADFLQKLLPGYYMVGLKLKNYCFRRSVIRIFFFN